MAATPGPVAEGEDILSNNITSSGTLVSGPCRVRGYAWASDGTAGSLILKDNGSGGTTRLTVTIPAATTADAVTFPGGGIRFNTDVYGTISHLTGLTIFYAT